MTSSPFPPCLTQSDTGEWEWGVVGDASGYLRRGFPGYHTRPHHPIYLRPLVCLFPSSSSSRLSFSSLLFLLSSLILFFNLPPLVSHSFFTLILLFSISLSLITLIYSSFPHVCFYHVFGSCRVFTVCLLSLSFPPSCLLSSISPTLFVSSCLFNDSFYTHVFSPPLPSPSSLNHCPSFHFCLLRTTYFSSFCSYISSPPPPPPTPFFTRPLLTFPPPFLPPILAFPITSHFLMHSSIPTIHSSSQPYSLSHFFPLLSLGSTSPLTTGTPLSLSLSQLIS